MRGVKSKVYFLLSLAGLVLLGCEAPSSDSVLLPVSGASKVGNVSAVFGTYGPLCVNRTGGWKVEYGNSCGPAVDLPLLSVEEGNSECVPLLTGAVVDCEIYHTQGIPLDGNYEPYGVPFIKEGQCDPGFYGNGAIGDPLYGGKKFYVKFVFSHELKETNADAIAIYNTVELLIIDEKVPAPDYVADTSLVDVRVDANKKVLSSQGMVVLQPGMVLADSYIVVPLIPSTLRNYSYVHSIFEASSTKIPVGTNILSSQLILPNDDLSNPKKYDIILRNRKSGVSSYEIITLAISKP